MLIRNKAGQLVEDGREPRGVVEGQSAGWGTDPGTAQAQANAPPTTAPPPGVKLGVSWGSYTRPDGSKGTIGDGLTGDPNVSFAGSTFEGAQPGNTSITDPRDFMYGRDPNFVQDHAADARAFGDQQQNLLTTLGNGSLMTGDLAQQSAQNFGTQLWDQGTSEFNRAKLDSMQQLGTAGKMGDTADQQLALAGQIGGATGQSAADAQLQSGLNASQASNLALARSGRGFGQSGAALGQAIDANAAAGMQTANNAAQLRLQSQEAAGGLYGQAGNTQNNQAGVYGSASQQQQQAALANQASGVNTTQAGYGTQLQSQQLAGQTYAQGAGEGFAGMNAEKSYNDAQQQSDLAHEQIAEQQYITASGANTAANALQAQTTGAIAGAAGTIAGGVIGTFAGGPAGGALGAGMGGAAGNAAAQASDIRAKANIKPADGEMASPIGISAPRPQVAPTAPGGFGAPRPQAAPMAPGGLAAPRPAAAPMAPGGPMAPRPMIPPVAQAVPRPAPPNLGAAIGAAGAGAAGGASPLSTLASLAQGRARMSGSGQPQAMVPPAAVQQAVRPPGAGIGAALGAGMVASDEHSKTRIQELEAQVASLKNNPQAAAASPQHTMREFYQPPNVSGFSGGMQLGQALAAARAKAQGQADAANAAPRAPVVDPAVAARAARIGAASGAAASAASAMAGHETPLYGMTHADQSNAWQDRVLGQQLHDGTAQGETPEGDAPLPVDASNAAPWLDRYMSEGDVASDKEVKSGASGDGDVLGDTFGNLHGYSYDYRDPDRHGEGRQYGFMAQDLAQTPAGATAIKRDPSDGTMMVDTGKLAMLQAPVVGKHERKLADLQAEIDQLLKRKAS